MTKKVKLIGIINMVKYHVLHIKFLGRSMFFYTLQPVPPPDDHAPFPALVTGMESNTWKKVMEKNSFNATEKRIL
jgi:hypothetical protein